ncbi:hypothetical protein CDAR_174841 [Caerostris darwini]|uniref:Uncharacterized protein n=1 Tax=Caerostris darwini TaxID=1538125 RepID=A0AAV4WS27_9ARAC|nr:hypothetical protein CDAR_174841 [Caerostris darwini]
MLNSIDRFTGNIIINKISSPFKVSKYFLVTAHSEGHHKPSISIVLVEFQRLSLSQQQGIISLLIVHKLYPNKDEGPRGKFHRWLIALYRPLLMQADIPG